MPGEGCKAIPDDPLLLKSHNQQEGLASPLVGSSRGLSRAKRCMNINHTTKTPTRGLGIHSDIEVGIGGVNDLPMVMK